MNSDKSSTIWHIGLTPWIIQDGNYPDFHVGENHEFALEFYSESLQKSTSEEIFFEYIDGGHYKVRAKVVFITEGWIVIDFGIKAYSQQVKVSAKLNDYIEGEIYLGIDPFFYFESLSKQKDSPALSYDWKITEILEESAPLVSEIMSEQKVFVADNKKKTVRPVKETKAWVETKNQNLHYVLVSELISGPHLPLIE